MKSRVSYDFSAVTLTKKTVTQRKKDMCDVKVFRVSQK